MLREIKTPMTQAQSEFLKLQLHLLDLPEEYLNELRIIISRFLLEKVRDHADRIWEEKGYSMETIEKWLNED